MYKLESRPAEEISVGDVLRVLEGGLEAVDCPGNSAEGDCDGADLCVAKYVWKRINDSITNAVDTLSLHELIEESLRIQESNSTAGKNPGCRSVSK